MYVFDGLFKGGLLLMMAEISAEMGFPLSESLTYGFIESIKNGFLFIINFTMEMLVNPVMDKQTKQKEHTDLEAFYITLVVLLGLMVTVSFFIVYKA